MVRQAVDPGEFRLDRLGEGEGVQPLAQMLERLQGVEVGVRRGQEPIEGRLRTIVFALEAGADADIAQELHGRLEEIHHEAQLVAVELVEEREGVGGVKARPAEELADVRPYLKALRRSSGVSRSLPQGGDRSMVRVPASGPVASFPGSVGVISPP